jgi:excisionase family DNA binding protein
VTSALDRQNSGHTINYPGRTKPREEQRARAMDEVPMIEDRLWSVEEVSYYLGVPVNTLYMWRSEGKGPASRRVGRHLRYRAEDVRAWVQGLDGWAVA